MTISKKQFCIIFGITDNSVKGRVLRKHFITDEILNKIGLDPKVYKTIKVFDRSTSIKLIKALSISKDELSKVNISILPELV